MQEILRHRNTLKKAVRALSWTVAALWGVQASLARADVQDSASWPAHSAIPMATAMDPPPVSDDGAILLPIPPAARPGGQAGDPQALSEDLQEAVRTGNAARIRFLVRHGAALNAVDENSRTPLMLAVIFDQPVAVKQLLALGANRLAKDREGLTAFAHARKLGLPRIARLLAKH